MTIFGAFLFKTTRNCIAYFKKYIAPYSSFAILYTDFFFAKELFASVNCAFASLF